MFDRGLTFQYGVFTRDLVEIPKALVSAVGSLNAPSEPRWMLRGLKEPVIEQALVALAGSPFVPSQTLTWATATGVWRIVATRLRIDITFDAAAYLEAKEQEAPLPDVTAFIIPNIAALLGSANVRPKRLALIVAGQAAPTNDRTGPAKILARRFLSREQQDAADSGELIDGTVRINRSAAWPLSSTSAQATSINRIETVTANWSLKDAQVQTHLSWQADVNTAPTVDLDVDAGDETVSTFFKRAAAWASERMATIGGDR